MAGDLIPPPSPAGRADPDAAREQEAFRPRLPSRPELDEPLLEEPAAPRGSRYRSRFGFITGALVGVALAALAVVAVLATRDDPVDPAANWSAWKPTSSNDLVRAAEIAQHVGLEYRLNNGSQLVDVEAGPLALNDVPLTPVVRTAPKGGDIVPIYGTGVLYVLNGLGPDGSIAQEKPSAQRMALIEREALELALYTFHYVKGVDHVVALLPSPASSSGSASSTSSAAPLSADKPVRTLLFRPGDVKAMLQAPLAASFPTAPPRPATISDQETSVLTQFTANNLFMGSVVPNQAGQGYLVLDRLDVPTAAEQLLQSTLPSTSSKAKKKSG